MQAAQTIAGYADLFSSLQSVQATVQTQIERFQRLMTDIKLAAGAHPDEAGARAVGNAALKLHRAHALLYGAGEASASVTSPQIQTDPASEEVDLQHALGEFSTLLSHSQNTSREVTALLDGVEQEIAQLRSPAN
ncbi:hypothetical protein J2W49_001924 [Hydrogenophaga palleronii]|uniref:DUF2383 domain-containing protein n=1 Tax=Hydrogenophaga palleronii TaxID=65655 RepID=A0ABU1WL89_9BURK|nr:hypothetical protein [Hydrogenophaga palleronii]MDR7149969.1 hypothetical protein [Hydrogenophaga palleronii]